MSRMCKQPSPPMYGLIFDLLSPLFDALAAVQYSSDDGRLPDSLCTFYRVSSTPEGFFSGEQTRENERYSVAVCDRDKSALEEKEPLVRDVMKKAGFLYITTSGDTLDTVSGHWQRTIDFRFYREV